MAIFEGSHFACILSMSELILGSIQFRLIELGYTYLNGEFLYESSKHGTRRQRMKRASVGRVRIFFPSQVLKVFTI